MNVNSLPKTVTRQRRGCDLNPGPSAPDTNHSAIVHGIFRLKCAIFVMFDDKANLRDGVW